VTISQKSRPPLLTQLVEQILEYCRLKLLEKELTEPEAAGTGIHDVRERTEEEHEEQLAKLLRRCTETYGQLLLAHSDAKPPTSHREKASSPWESSNHASCKSLLSDGAVSGRSKKADDWSPRGREQKHPTPFYETAYALVARAVQQRMRAAAEGSRLAQEKGGLAQLAARVEEELGWLFRSHEFGRRSRGLRQRGAQADASGGPEGVESAQLAARAEAKLGEIIKNVSKSTTKLHDKFAQLESRFRRQDEAKQVADQMDKIPSGGADNKEAVVDHCASQGTVDEKIAAFWLRAGPKHSRAEQSTMMHHVVSTRSPMINALLPSAHEQAQVVKKATRQAFRQTCSQRRQMLTPRESQRAQMNGGYIVGSNGHDGQMSRQISEAVDTAAAPAFKNTWALSQERIGHNLAKAQQRPPVLDRLVASKVA